ncbi:outer membrane protein assembly factor BamE [Geitlerinema splendidum]|jgi:outer membrane protein assembly factor BamE (lipoprotein component of BamABCDE complex)|nr:outer membrane protein assembly factor BamE [Geitlerinema splendidum]
MNYRNLLTIALTGALLTGCKSAQELREEVTAGQGPSTFSLGQVQSSIHQGTSQEQVLSTLGAPNIVTNDDRGNETWVYDKISTEGARASSEGGGSLILFGAFSRANAYEATQKTLTVMIKFDNRKRVQTVNYHQSKF